MLTEQDLCFAFKKNHEIYLRKVHLFLNKKYYINLFNDNEHRALDITEIYKLKHIERIWMNHEVRECLNRYDCYRDIHEVLDVSLALNQHPVFQHKLFDYLQSEATLDDLKHFILNDSILNLEFFDYLILSIIGAPDQSKAEIITNLWDEAGRGNIKKFHTVMFRNFLSDLDLTYKRDAIIENMSWEGIAGINLFNYLSQYSHHKMKYYGLLAATEMLDPPHYYRLINGIARLTKQHHLDYSYYIEHETIDVDHAKGWLNKVILPELMERPDKIPEFWIGFYLRLDSAQRYFDRLLMQFTAKQAA